MVFVYSCPVIVHVGNIPSGIVSGKRIPGGFGKINEEEKGGRDRQQRVDS